MGLTAHNILQSGRQTAFGTPYETATAKLQGVTSFKPVPELQARILNELRGSLAPGFTTVLDGYKASATFETEAETYEDINYWLDSLFTADASPGGAGPYTRAYAAPLTAAATPKFLTLQFGQSGGVVQLDDVSVATLTLSGESNGTLQVGGSLLASKASVGSLVALSDRTGNTAIMGSHATLYIDAFGATSGTTEIASSSFAWEMSINTNREYRAYLGDSYPTAWNDNKWSGQLKLSLEYNATTDDYITALLASPNAILEKVVRLKYVTGAGATERIFQFDFAGKSIQAPDMFTDRNGIVAYDLVLDGVYNTTMANWLKVDTTSNISALA